MANEIVNHYKRIMHVTNEAARNWYIKEASEQMWSYATLNRNISTQGSIKDRENL